VLSEAAHDEASVRDRIRHVFESIRHSRMTIWPPMLSVELPAGANICRRF
jgi:hypothetical protein